MNNVYYLSSERIYLREVRLSDVNERYYSWLNDPEIYQFLETRFVPRSLDNIADFVKRMDAKENEPFMAICLKENDLHIGNIKLGPINWHHRNADISLFIGDKNYWGKGLATEAIQVVTDYAFHMLNLNKIKAGCHATNLGSMKAFEKCGYLQEGLLRSHGMSNGVLYDAVLLGITAQDYWQGVKK
jgi:RimJ/RimL family protein N-acetyltransferase